MGEAFSFSWIGRRCQAAGPTQSANVRAVVYRRFCRSMLGLNVREAAARVKVGKTALYDALKQEKLGEAACT
ncbi:hypothetical protein GGQ99_005179 [Aminobacter niigataensis]|uniref:DNA binding HTH domain-containing protein n=1 Tax=Aminobacter niigataensis TaxID=83265 RepID=A0ABR6L9A1_9HYPH|nr:hypothetical protein [Aminobacter niigataensis]MBB4653388.1 hypothetical protein [Aminobacter niigataensis]